MGLGGVSSGSLMLTLLIVMVLFGTKKLRTIGEDIGIAIRGFKKGLNGELDSNETVKNTHVANSQASNLARGNTIEHDYVSIREDNSLSDNRHDS